MGKEKENMLAQCKNCRKWRDKSSLDGNGTCIQCRRNFQIGRLIGG
jgi:hypothetical protein